LILRTKYYKRNNYIDLLVYIFEEIGVYILSLKINPKRINPFKKSCCILWNCEEIKIENGQHLKVCNNGETVIVNIFDSGQINCQGSPKSKFLEFVKSITENIANTIEIPFSECENQLKHRSETLFTYIKTLNIQDVIQRMSVIILCDTSCEILLRARITMIAQKEIIPQKEIEKLKNRDNMFSFIKKKYNEVIEKKIHDLRLRRNKLVHQGDIPTEKDAIFAIDVLTKYLEL